MLHASSTTSPRSTTSGRRSSPWRFPVSTFLRARGTSTDLPAVTGARSAFNWSETAVLRTHVTVLPAGLSDSASANEIRRDEVQQGVPGSF